MNSIPTYVYIIFILLLSWGVKSLFAQTVDIKRLVLLPIAFLILALKNIDKLFSITNTTDILTLALGISIGCIIGYFYTRKHHIKVNKKDKTLVHIPGSWIVLTSVMFISPLPACGWSESGKWIVQD